MKKYIAMVLALIMIAVTAYTTVYAEKTVSVDPNITQSGIQAIRDSLELVWSDDFGKEGDPKKPLKTTNDQSGEAIDKDAQWIHETSAMHRNGQQQVYADNDGENSWTEDGKLVIEARREKRTVGSTTFDYTSDAVRSSYITEDGRATHKAFRFGMIEARIKIPNGQNNNESATSLGMWNGFWTVGMHDVLTDDVNESYWPYDGELDIMESWTDSSVTGCNAAHMAYHHAYNRKEDNQGYHHVANTAATFETGSQTKGSQIGDAGYHTYGVYYTPTQLVWYVDDVILKVYDITADEYYALRECPQYIILSFPIGAGTCGMPTDDFMSAQMLVDYVHVYQASAEKGNYLNLNDKKQDISYYQEAIDDYSHINVMTAESDLAYSGTNSNRYQYWGGPSLGSYVIQTGASASIDTLTKLEEGKYDIYVAGMATSSQSKNKIYLNGVTTGQVIDFSESTKNDFGVEYAMDKSAYVGTAEIVNGAHNLHLTCERTDDSTGKNALIRSVVAVKNSKNATTVTIDKDTDLTPTTTTAKPTTKPTGGAETTTAKPMNIDWKSSWNAETDTCPENTTWINTSIKSENVPTNSDTNSTKTLECERVGTYSGDSAKRCGVIKIPVNGALAGAKKLRVWIAGNDVAVNSAQGCAVLFDYMGETHKVAALNVLGQTPEYKLTKEGGYYEIDLTKAAYYSASSIGSKKQTFFTDYSTVSNKDDYIDLSQVANVYIAFGKKIDYDSNDFKGSVYYVDDLQAGFESDEPNTEPTTPTTVPTANFTGTKSAVSSLSGFSVTLPVTGVPENGGYLVGWTSNGKIYKPGTSVSLDGDTTFTAVGLRFEMTDGAGIRWAKNHDDRGMRFQTKINKEDVDNLAACGAKFLTGTFISKHTGGFSDSGWVGGFRNVNGADVGNYTRNNLSKGNGLDVPNTNNSWYDADETYYYYYGGVVGMCFGNNTHEEDSSSVVTMKIAARSYVTITYSDGTIDDVLSAYSPENNIRTMQQIANAALADADFGYSANQIKILKEQYGATEGSSSSSYLKEAKDALGK